MDEMTEKHLEKLKSRFQFLVTMYIFFPVILEYLFKAGAKTDIDLAKPMIYYGLQISILILGYIILENTNYWKSEYLFKLTNLIIFTNLVSFASVLFIFAQAVDKTNNSIIYLILFKLTFILILVLPVIILSLFILNILTREYIKNINQKLREFF